ncbi:MULTISPECIES: class-III pyridoxal-phosphate-dependent aminotransferase [Halolamina]|uniref:4-aminobutyrate aminotransferase n=1 Tax=Halolamina pelagica TaxID=699431 RepID=A0A1I5VCK6_9EURY|nr:MULTISPECIES: aminotransferase class III-fold pyridoxal phosphate-dependent enzyme [Halolamina]NHX37694.1 aminotransferase class III-fold pyridoxal phosphate-dependent enzyme [Halolamina sp. R1-12]SFQ05253.1 4-aminobutyrate aminotransferase [Halolamina pelagica]
MDRDTVEPEVTDLPGDRAQEWVDYHHEFSAPSTYVYEFVWDHTAPAEGPFCTDVDGNVLMDFTSHVAAAPLGYNNPKLMEPLSEFDLVDPLKIAGQDFYAADGKAPGEGLPGAAGLMDRITDISSSFDMDTVFLSNSGAEAVENAMKVSYDHNPLGKYALTFDGAFHGRTLGALSLNRSKEVYRRRFPEIASVHDFPFCSCGGAPEDCQCGYFTGDTTALRSKLDPKTGHVNPEEVAFLIMEPIQGEGGYRFPSEAFARDVAEVTEEYDITLIADEIQSGLGRTGEWWASEHYPFDPDVITSAKGLRVGATVSDTEVFPEETGRLSSTWGAGDVVAAAQGAFTIDAIEEYDLLENATRRGRQFQELMHDADLDGVTSVRGKGLMLGLDFESKDLRDDVVDAAFARGLLLLACGKKTIRVLPPMDVTEREIELGAELFIDAIEAEN